MSFDRNATAEQARAAESLIQNYRDIIDGDEDAKLDLIEGETQLVEAIAAGIHRIQVIDHLVDGIKEYQSKLAARRSRLTEQKQFIRGCIGAAMSQAELKSVEVPPATVTRKAVPPKLIVDETREAEIPSDYWEMLPKLNTKKLTDDLKAGKDVPGATMSNGSETIQIRGA